MEVKKGSRVIFLEIKKIEGTKILIFFLMPILVLLYFYNLEYAPNFWYDEAHNMLVSKSIVNNGAYALDSANGLLPFDALISTGPTFLMPVAASFKLFGMGVWQGRLISAIAMISSIFMMYLISRYIFNEKIAVIAIYIYATSPWFVYYGRSGLGDMLAISLLFFSSFLWLKANENNDSKLLLMSGIFFGMAALTKYAFLLVIPLLVFTFAISAYIKKPIKIKSIIFPFASIITIFVLWYLYQASIIGYEGISGRLAEVRNFIIPNSAFNPSKNIIYSLAYLIMENKIIFTLGLPSLFYIIILTLDRLKENKVDIKTTYLLLILSVWFTWYLVSSGTQRFANPALAIFCIFIAKTLYDFFLRQSSEHKDSDKYRYQVGMFIVFAIVFVNMASDISLVKAHNDDAQKFSSYIESNISPNHTITSKEEEIVFLTNKPINLNNAINNQLEKPYKVFDYIITGPITEKVLVDFYPECLLKNYYLEHTEGRFSLYRLNNYTIPREGYSC